VDVDVAAAGALFGDPARAAMLTALSGGVSLPAGELAKRAGVTPATATTHLRRLIDGGLVRVRAQGRHRYHELAGPEVAAVLEALALVAPRVQVRSLRQSQTAEALTEARTCYDHLAGRLGVVLRDGLVGSGAILCVDERNHILSDIGLALLDSAGIDPAVVQASRRVFARSCIDWTQRRPHLSGAMPAAITAQFIARGYLQRRPGDRALNVAPNFYRYLSSWLGIEVNDQERAGTLAERGLQA
jgi:DNA-binding transcriptional ArsR family regulator